MPNGFELNDRIKFENSVKSLSIDDRVMRVAMMLYDHCYNQDGFLEQVRANTTFRKIGTVIGTILFVAVVSLLVTNIFR